MIIDYIPKGYENRVTRGYLGSVVHEKDRVIRREIAECPEAIIHDEGYFIPESVEDLPHIEAYIKRETARAAAILKRVQKAREAYWRIEVKHNEQI